MIVNTFEPTTKHGEPLPEPRTFKRQTAEEVLECVARGAEWLDTNFPEWIDRVDIDCLDLSEGSSCILGQSAGLITDYEVEPFRMDSYTRTMDYIAGIVDDEANTWARRHGFLLTPVKYLSSVDSYNEEYLVDVENDERWVMLTLGWQSLLAERGSK